MVSGTIALTREVSGSFARCQLTHVPRAPIDLGRAREQHAAYEEALRGLHCEVRRLPPAPDLPDSVFVEDTVVVLPALAVLTRPGAPSRRAEVGSVGVALAELRPVVAVDPPATLDGGDVLCVGRTLYVGRSARTNAAGVAALRRAVAPYGHDVVAVDLRGCLHLKTAVTLAAEGLLLANPDWVDVGVFAGLEIVAVDPTEPFAANALHVSGSIVYPAAFPRTRERLEGRGLRVVAVDVSEIAKAEGGVTCCSILVAAAPASGAASPE